MPEGNTGFCTPAGTNIFIMKRSELNYRTKRFSNEERRLKKQIWKKILKIVSPYFQDWNDLTGHSNMMLFTKYKDHSLHGSYSHTKDYTIKHAWHDSISFCGFADDGLINEVNRWAWAARDYETLSVQELMLVLRKLEKMTFTNVVDNTVESNFK